MIGRDLFAQLQRAIRPLQTRIANSIARAVVQRVDDSTKLQLLQIGVMAGEDVDEAERFQQYGVASVPLEGAEAVVLFPNGDRSHPLVVAVDDRRHRPTGEDPGTVTVYNSDGARVRLKAGGGIEVEPAGGERVEIREDGVALTALDGLVHGRGIDPFTGQTYAALTNTSDKVRSQK